MAEMSLGERLRVSLRAWLIDHWRGDLSLAESFWINCFFVNLGAGILFRRMEPSATGLVLFGMLSIGISVWQLVGLWRSAHKNAKKQPFWSAIVKGLCVLNVTVFVLIVLGVLLGGLSGGGGIDVPVPSSTSSVF